MAVKVFCFQYHSHLQCSRCNGLTSGLFPSMAAVITHVECWEHEELTSTYERKLFDPGSLRKIGLV